MKQSLIIYVYKYPETEKKELNHLAIYNEKDEYDVSLYNNGEADVMVYSVQQVKKFVSNLRYSTVVYEGIIDEG